ncbi:MAG: hypothetical protein PUB43_02600 [Oscillospiraceae bacterium]|nr:hypothetical protein [Oscillospiraceae bacterium]
MTVKVIKKFRDKETGKINKVDDILEITDERLAEIKEVGNFVEEIKESDDETANKTDGPEQKETKKTAKKAEK